MGLPLVGKRHQRQIGSPKSATRDFGAVSERIESTGGGRRPTFDHQPSIHAQRPVQHHRQHPLGALFQRGTAPEGNLHARYLLGFREELDSPAMGESTAGGSQDRRCGTVAAGSGFSGRNKGQDQVCDVGHVFSRGPLGILRAQSHLLGNPGWERGQERPKYRSEGQRKAPAFTPGPVAGAGQVGPGRTGLPGSIAGVPYRSAWRRAAERSERCAGWTAISKSKPSMFGTPTTGGGEGI